MKRKKERVDREELEEETPPRLAGLRPDELAPDEENDPEGAAEIHAAGTPGGGTASGGLGGTNHGDGALDGADLENEMGSGAHDPDDEPKPRVIARR